MVPVVLARAPSFGNVTVTIEMEEGVIEITTLNNRATATINSSLLAFNSRPRYIGPDPLGPFVFDEDSPTDEPLLIVDITTLFEDETEWDQMGFTASGDLAQTNVKVEFIEYDFVITNLKMNWHGNISLSLRVTDDGGTGGPDARLGTDSPQFKVIIRPVNDPPSYVGPVEGSTYTVDEDPDLTEPIALHDVTRLFTDVDGDPLRYRLEVPEVMQDKVTLEVINGSLCLVDVEEDWNGEVTYRVIAFDDGEDGIADNQDDLLASSPRFTLSILPVNDAPTTVGKIPRVTMDGDHPQSMDLAPFFEDVDGDVLFFVLTFDPAAVVEAVITKTQTSDAMLTVTLVDADFYGYIQVNITCYDRDPVGSAEQPLSVTTGFILEVRGDHPPPDWPPTEPLLSADPAEPEEGEEVVLTATGAVDPEGTDLMYMWRLEGHLLFDWSANHSIRHTFDTAGTYNITVIARDLGQNTNSTTLVLVVKEKATPEPPDPDPEPEAEPSSFWTGLAIGLVIAIVAVSMVLYLYRFRPD